MWLQGEMVMISNSRAARLQHWRLAYYRKQTKVPFRRYMSTIRKLPKGDEDQQMVKVGGRCAKTDLAFRKFRKSEE
jgi:hypothetical protein